MKIKWKYLFESQKDFLRLFKYILKNYFWKNIFEKIFLKNIFEKYFWKEVFSNNFCQRIVLSFRFVATHSARQIKMITFTPDPIQCFSQATLRFPLWKWGFWGNSTSKISKIFETKMLHGGTFFKKCPLLCRNVHKFNTFFMKSFTRAWDRQLQWRRDPRAPLKVKCKMLDFPPWPRDFQRTTAGHARRVPCAEPSTLNGARGFDIKSLYHHQTILFKKWLALK